MNTKMFLTSVVALNLLLAVSGCGTVAGAAGSAIAGSAVSGALAGGGNKARFSRMSCDELSKEIASAQRSMMNPTNIPYARAYIRDAQEVAADMGCEMDV